MKSGRLYMIAGNSSQINICNYVKEYSEMTIVERRGFSGGYKKGCACEVRYIQKIYIRTCIIYLKMYFLSFLDKTNVST